MTRPIHGTHHAPSLPVHRRFPIGAEVFPNGVHFRVWAPARRKVAIVINSVEYPLEAEERGYFSGLVHDARAGTLYRVRLDDDETTYPDPASRFQPTGPHGESEVIDPLRYPWKDEAWRGPSLRGAVFYEMHLGTFTREGTYAGAIEQLPRLAELGITAIELMPVNEFPGDFGWGYDGVGLWAPTRLYGNPDDFRRFVDAAHQHGLAVILDVVYNHLGPDGNYLSEFTPNYFTKKYENEWGDPINFDGDDSHGVRTFFVENAACWIEEFHLDGLRVDATQSMHDKSEKHILRELTDRVRAAAGERSVLIVAENEPQDTRLLREYGFDAVWNDDWHHAALVALTGRREAYYADYRGKPQEFVSMAKYNFLYQGQRYRWQKKRRGTAAHDLEPPQFVCYLENHDQVANSAKGARLPDLTSPAELRAMSALLLLQPQTPMLFQGEEFGSRRRFVYFAHHGAGLAETVAKGRAEFIGQFRSVATKEMQSRLPPPHECETFESSKLDHGERNVEIETLIRDLLRLRREEPFASQRHDHLHGSVLGDDCFALRWLTGGDDDRLLVVNLGRDLQLDPAPDPLLAPPRGLERWTIQWSSEWPQYGGSGTAELDTEENWQVPAKCAVVLKGR